MNVTVNYAFKKTRHHHPRLKALSPRRRGGSSLHDSNGGGIKHTPKSRVMHQVC